MNATHRFRSPRRLAGVLALVATAVPLPTLGHPEHDPHTPAGRIESPCAIAALPGRPDAELKRWIARVKQAAGDEVREVAHLERLGWAYVQRYRSTFDEGLLVNAAATAACIDSIQVNAPQALLLDGYVSHQQHRFGDAEQVARRLVRERGLWFDHALLGDVLFDQGKLDAAIDAYQRLADQRPGPQAYIRAANVRAIRGDLSGATELMRMAVLASGPHAPEAAAWARVRLAELELQAGRAAYASRLIDAALELRDDYAPALALRGRLALAAGAAAEAVELLTRAVARRPLPEYRWALIEALELSGDHERAGAEGRRLAANGKVEDARTYTLYLATRGLEPGMALHLAEHELMARQDVFTLDTLAWALRANGRTEEAWEYTLRATAENTRDPRLLLHSGVIAAATGRSDQARAWLGEAHASRGLLLPSEQQLLEQAFAALQPQTSVGPQRLSKARLSQP